MSQTNKDIARIIDGANLAFRSLGKVMRQAQKSLELFGDRVAAALNPMNRYRWPGKREKGMSQESESEPLHRNPAIAAGQILKEAGLPIDVKKVFEMADWCDEQVEGDGNA